MYTTIEIETTHSISTIWLNRPEMRNALNDAMIRELTQAFQTLSTTEEVRVIVLRGRGKVFCAGADLNWMKNVAAYNYKENYNDSLQLAQCFHAIYQSPKPTIGLAHGAAMGGANGLLAACDLAFCTLDTTFAFSEVKLGIIPATISPYILKRLGESKSRELMLTGKRILAPLAEKMGLVNQAVSADKIEDLLNETLSELLSAAPGAISQCKQLIDQLAILPFQESLPYTAEMIAASRASTEGQEGMNAFLEKRKASWVEPLLNTKH